MTHVPEVFVEEHKEEIKRLAFCIYQQRERYNQPDRPAENFFRAAEITKENYDYGRVNSK